MTGALDYLTGASAPPAEGLSMPHAGSVLRARRTVVTDPYSQQPVPGGDWGADETIEGAHVTGAQSVLTEADGRQQQTTRPTLVCPAGADVRVGDRITDGDRVFEVAAHAAKATNPFTGWTPPQEVPLKEVTG